MSLYLAHTRKSDARPGRTSCFSLQKRPTAPKGRRWSVQGKDRQRRSGLGGYCTLHSSIRVGHLPGKPWPLRSPALPLLLGEGGCSALGSRFSGRCYCGGVRGQVGRARWPKAGGLSARQTSRRPRGRPAQAPCVRASACPAGGHAVRPSAGRGERRRERSKVTGAGTSARRPSGIRSPAAREPVAPPDTLRSAGMAAHRRARPDKDPRSDTSSSASRRNPATAATGTV